MGTVEHPNCTKCGEAIRGDIYHIGGGNFHIWCAPKVEFPVGCICPPGANLQCERFDCPRKGIKIETGVGSAAKE